MAPPFFGRNVTMRFLSIADISVRLGAAASGPSVWTGRALQAENDDLEKVGLALLYPAY
jgi:hypothetical protein